MPAAPCAHPSRRVKSSQGGGRLRGVQAVAPGETEHVRRQRCLEDERDAGAPKVDAGAVEGLAGQEQARLKPGRPAPVDELEVEAVVGPVDLVPARERASNRVTDGWPSPRTADLMKTGLDVSAPSGWSTVTAPVSSPVSSVT